MSYALKRSIEDVKKTIEFHDKKISDMKKKSKCCISKTKYQQELNVSMQHIFESKKKLSLLEEELRMCLKKESEDYVKRQKIIREQLDGNFRYLFNNEMDILRLKSLYNNTKIYKDILEIYEGINQENTSQGKMNLIFYVLYNTGYYLFSEQVKDGITCDEIKNMIYDKYAISKKRIFVSTNLTYHCAIRIDKDNNVNDDTKFILYDKKNPNKCVLVGCHISGGGMNDDVVALKQELIELKQELYKLKNDMK